MAVSVRFAKHPVQGFQKVNSTNDLHHGVHIHSSVMQHALYNITTTLVVDSSPLRDESPADAEWSRTILMLGRQLIVLLTHHVPLVDEWNTQTGQIAFIKTVI